MTGKPRFLDAHADIRRLQMLAEVDRTGSIAGAARALHISGPAVSQQLAALERHAGTALLARGGRSVALTAAGRLLVARSQPVFDGLEDLRSLIAGQKGVTGELHVAAPASAIRRWLTVAHAALGAQEPGLQLAIYDRSSRDALELLRSRDVDLAIVYRSARDADPSGGLHHTHLAEEPMSLALRRDDIDQSTASLRERRWITAPCASHSYAIVERWCTDAGFEPAVWAQTVDEATTFALVAAGAGVAIVPPPTGAVPEDVVLHPLDPPVSRHAFLVTRAGGERHPAVSLLVGQLT